MIAASGHAATGFAGKVSHVSDGDTLWVAPDGGGAPRKVRIDGIDAPEICQPGGRASRAALEQRALGRHAQVQVRRRDDYGRELARVRVDGQDVGAWMVREGQAWSYRWRRQAGPYAAEETQARQARRGLFAAVGPEQPRDFRRRHGPCPVR
jgi:micrococcal nuclease